MEAGGHGEQGMWALNAHQAVVGNGLCTGNTYGTDQLKPSSGGNLCYTMPHSEGCLEEMEG
jgi:hypothetical protein